MRHSAVALATTVLLAGCTEPAVTTDRPFVDVHDDADAALLAGTRAVTEVLASVAEGWEGAANDAIPADLCVDEDGAPMLEGWALATGDVVWSLSTPLPDDATEALETALVDATPGWDDGSPIPPASPVPPEPRTVERTDPSGTVTVTLGARAVGDGAIVVLHVVTACVQAGLPTTYDDVVGEGWIEERPALVEAWVRP